MISEFFYMCSYS